MIELELCRPTTGEPGRWCRSWDCHRGPNLVEACRGTYWTLVLWGLIALGGATLR
jgi:hypothetical protein